MSRAVSQETVNFTLVHGGKFVLKKPPVIERGMMTQYRQLDDAPIESMEYWEEAERYLLVKEQE